MAKHLNKELIKRIAIYKKNNPELTHEEIANDFGVKAHQVRYAIEKYSEAIEMARSTKKGTQEQASIILEDIDDFDTLRKQLLKCLAELECNDKLATSSRVDILLKVTRIRRYIQTLELENHMKRADADIIANIVKRFLPNATNDEVIKIYQEELAKWKAEGK